MEHRGLRLLISSLVALVAIQMQAEAQQLPRLVVCISVDQLRTDYLRELEPMMGEGGLRRMLRSGRVYEQVDFPFTPINAASATASIFTGTYPQVHGVEASELYQRSLGRSQGVYADDNYLGNYTRDNLSPRALLVGTLGDRLKEASAGAALVYSVAPTPEQAIASAGIWADGAYWLDGRIASWATSNYYPQMLQTIERYNRSDAGPNKRLVSGITWKPLQAYARPTISYSDWGRRFQHRYQSKDATRYRESGIVNEEVTTLALQLLEGAGYAERKSPGLLSLNYTAKPQGVEELMAEDVDTYLRLDAELKRLFEALDKRLGLHNCLITLSGTGYTGYTSYKDSKSERLKRSVSVARLTALINMYLTAQHGPGEWISHNANGRLYLNHKLVESKRLSLESLQSDIADFLSAAEGIGRTVPAHELASSGDDYVRRLARATVARYRADVYWSVLPGWQVEDLASNPQLNPVSTAIPTPFIIMGQGMERSTTPLPRIEVRDIVRIICSYLRIRPPND